MATTDDSRGDLVLLPVELLRQIAALLPKRALKRLRLMSRKLNTLASELLFKSIILGHERNSIVQLLNIAVNPHWSEQVRNIDWYMMYELANYWDDRVDDPTVKRSDVAKPCELDSIVSRLGFELDQFVGWSLQRRLLEKLVNVDTIRFIPDACTTKYYTADLFPLLPEARLRPLTIITPTLSLYLTYSDSGTPNGLEVRAIDRWLPWHKNRDICSKAGGLHDGRYVERLDSDFDTSLSCSLLDPYPGGFVAFLMLQNAD